MTRSDTFSSLRKDRVTLFSGPCLHVCAPYSSSDEKPQASHAPRVNSSNDAPLSNVRATLAPSPSAPVAPVETHTAPVPASACSTTDDSTSAGLPPRHRTGPPLSPACRHGAPCSAARVPRPLPPAPPAHHRRPADRPQVSRSPSQSLKTSSAARPQCPRASRRSSPRGTASLRGRPPECPSPDP